MQRKCLVCVICNSNSIHSFIFKLSITIAHIEDVHLLFFAHLTKKSFWGSWIYTFFLIKMLRLLFCVICNSNSFHSLLCIIMFIHWTWAIPFLCTFDIYIFLNSGLLNLNIIPPEMLRGCLVCLICNLSSFYIFIFKHSIMIVHTLKLYTIYFVHIW